MLNEYSRKVDFLKGLLQAEKLVSTAGSAPRAPNLSTQVPASLHLSTVTCYVQASSSEKALANQFLAPGRVPTTSRERVPATKTVHLQSRARYTGQMRDELLGTVMPLPGLGTVHDNTST